MRGLPWLLSAGALIGAGGLLMTLGDAGAEAHKVRSQPQFPTRARAADVARESNRTTLAPAAAAPSKNGEAPRAHDPVLVALAPDAEVALVFEAGTILRSPVGQAMLGCLAEGDRERMDRRLGDQGKHWLDLAERIAVSKTPGMPPMLVAEGKLAGIAWEKVFPEATTRAFGVGTTIYDGASAQPGGAQGASAHPGGAQGTADERQRSWHAAIWHDGLLLASGDAASVEGALTRLDAGDASALPFGEGEAYGEVYGVVGREAIAKLVPEDLRERVHGAARRATVHVDATEEVLLVADVEGSDPTQVEDLGKSLGAAMAVGRLKARSEGQDDLVRLLDSSRVRPYGHGSLRAEVAIPTELMTKHLHGCRER